MTSQVRTERPTDIALRTIEPSSPGQIVNDSADENASSGLDRTTIAQLVATGFSYFFAGTNDGSLGAVTPYILRTYNVGTQYISILYGNT
jgi:hypothetical protein